MTRKDRLFDLHRLLKDGQTHRAEDIAGQLGVTVRTIYRDMKTLEVSGIPVTGSPGLGYQLRPDITLPALCLTELELEALHLGLAAVGHGQDQELTEAAQTLSDKIDAALPEEINDLPKGFGFAVYPFSSDRETLQNLAVLRSAIRSKQLQRIFVNGAYQDIRPLKLDYAARLWTLICWSETQTDFHKIRVDQISSVQTLPGLFVDEVGKRLSDYDGSTALPATGH